MSAGGEVCSQSSRFKLLVGDLPATFQVATKTLLQTWNRKQISTSKITRTAAHRIDGWRRQPVVLHINNSRVVQIHSSSSGLFPIFAKFFCASKLQKKVNKNGIESRPKKHQTSRKFLWGLKMVGGPVPVLLFFIVQGSLSEKLVLYSTSPPKQIIIKTFNERN